jgi:hypothetical protein
METLTVIFHRGVFRIDAVMKTLIVFTLSKTALRVHPSHSK